MSTRSETDDRPRKKKKKQAGGGALWLWLGIGGGGIVAVAGIIIVVVVAVRSFGQGDEKRKIIAENPQPQQPGKLGGEVVRQPQTTLGKVRAAGDRASQRNDMRQLYLFYEQYVDTNKNPATRTVDGFLEFMKRDSNILYNKIKTEKFYTVNVKARQGSDDIVVFETEEYAEGYHCWRANNDFGFFPAQELKNAGLVAP